MKWIFAAPLVFLAVVSSPVDAQVPLATQPLDSGVLVRARLHDGSALRGRLLTPFTPGTPSLRLCLYPGRPCSAASDDRARTIPTSGLTRLHVAAGTRVRTGAVVGALVGVLAGEFVYGLSKGLCESSGCVPPRFRTLLVGALGFGLFGAVFGTGFDAWAPAP